MACSRNKNWTTFTILLTALVVLSLSDQHSDEKSHCTADSCDSDETLKYESGTDEGSDSNEVHLAYSCVSPNFVPEEDVPVIFLHGMGDSGKTWNGIYQNIPILTHRKACVYDARNHGDSGWNDTLNVDVLAEDLGRLIDKLKFERVVIVGHSMGGLTGMKFALNNPSKVDRLIVEDVSPIRIPKAALNYALGFFDLLAKGITLVPKDADKNTAKTIIMDYFNELSDQKLPKEFFDIMMLHQRDGVWQWKANFNVIEKVLAEPDKAVAVNPQSSYTGKTLFIYGKVSPFGVDEDEEEIRKYFPNSEFIGVEGADHDVHFGHPEFQTELIKFLQ